MTSLAVILALLLRLGLPSAGQQQRAPDSLQAISDDTLSKPRG